MLTSHSILFRGLTSVVVNEMCAEALRTRAGTAIADMQYNNNKGGWGIVPWSSSGLSLGKDERSSEGRV